MKINKRISKVEYILLETPDIKDKVDWFENKIYNDDRISPKFRKHLKNILNESEQIISYMILYSIIINKDENKYNEFVELIKNKLHEIEKQDLDKSSYVAYHICVDLMNKTEYKTIKNCLLHEYNSEVYKNLTNDTTIEIIKDKELYDYGFIKLNEDLVFISPKIKNNMYFIDKIMDIPFISDRDKNEIFLYILKYTMKYEYHKKTYIFKDLTSGFSFMGINEVMDYISTFISIYKASELVTHNDEYIYKPKVNIRDMKTYSDIFSIFKFINRYDTENINKQNLEINKKSVNESIFYIMILYYLYTGNLVDVKDKIRKNKIKIYKHIEKHKKYYNDDILDTCQLLDFILGNSIRIINKFLNGDNNQIENVHNVLKLLYHTFMNMENVIYVDNNVFNKIKDDIKDIHYTNSDKFIEDLKENRFIKLKYLVDIESNKSI